MPIVAVWAQALGSSWLFAGLLIVGFATVSLLVNIYGKRRIKLVDGTITGSRLAKGKIRFISYITKEAANQN